MILASTPTIPSLPAALNSNIGGVTFSALSGAQLQQRQAPPAYSLQQSEVAQYSRNVYAVVLNGLTAQLGTSQDSVGARLAQLNLVGPFGTPPPPASNIAGAPVAPGASNGDYAAQVTASLRSLAGNGKIFQ